MTVVNFIYLHVSYFSGTVYMYNLYYEMVYFSHHCTAPQPPSGIMVDANGCNSAVVSWNAQQSRMCDAAIVSYSVRSRLTGSSARGGYNTVSTSSTSAIVGSLVPNAEYDVEVASINSNGQMGAYSAAIQFSIQGSLTYGVLFCVVLHT